MNSSESEETYL